MHGQAPASSYIVSSHCYAVVGYDAAISTPFTVYNPWGTTASGWARTFDGHAVYGLFTANANFLSANFTDQSIDSGTGSGLDAGQRLGVESATDLLMANGPSRELNGDSASMQNGARMSRLFASGCYSSIAPRFGFGSHCSGISKRLRPSLA